MSKSNHAAQGILGKINSQTRPEELVCMLCAPETQALRGEDRVAVADAVDDWLLNMDTDDGVLRREYHEHSDYLDAFPLQFRMDPNNLDQDPRPVLNRVLNGA